MPPLGRPSKRRYSKEEYKVIRADRERAKRELNLSEEWVAAERKKIEQDYPDILWPWKEKS